jgi:hypothetical protein
MKLRLFKARTAQWCALLLLARGLQSAEPVIRFVQLNTIRPLPAPSGRSGRTHDITEPAGTGGIAPSGPANIVRTPAGALGIYNNSQDANAADFVTNHGGPQIVTADIELIFWGSRWSNATLPAAADVTAAVKDILSGPYLSQMAQYGFQSLHLRGITYLTSPDPPTNYTGDDVTARVWDLIGSDQFPEPDEPGGRILYMFIMPPGTTPPPGLRGAHGDDWHNDIPLDIDRIWYGWTSYGTLDRITEVFGHELVESITNPEPDSPGWTMNRSLNGGNEIGDACNHTVDFLHGVDMQAYWSQAYRACVLPLDSGRPEINYLSQTQGPVTGGTKVVINGRLFVNVSGVFFGVTPAKSFTVDSPFQITAFSPAVDAGVEADIHVTTPFGDSMGSKFYYQPIVTSVDPNAGPIQGHNGVTVHGIGLSTSVSGSSVLFGGVPSPNVYCYDNTRCAVEVPPSAQTTVDVQVSAGGAYSQPVPADHYTYVGPTITKLIPNVGPEAGGTLVHFEGISLADGMIWRMNETRINVVCGPFVDCQWLTPPGTGVVNLSVEYNNVRSAPSPDSQFTYAKFPSIAGMVPATGPATGGTTVTIIGTNFVPGATRFDFGPNNPATNVQCATTQCTATTPAGASVVDVRATAGGFTSLVTAADHFSYASVVTSVSPNNGPENGGTAVAITGAGFVSTTPTESPKPPLVYFGDAYASDGICTTPTTCTATSPSGTGTVDVHVVVDGQHGTTAAAGRFTYNPAGQRGWTKYNIQPPYAESGPSLTYDPVRREILYAAPVSEDQGDNMPPIMQTVLWGWNAPSQTWQKKAPATVPAVSGGAFAFNEANGTAVLFGGQIYLYSQTGKSHGTQLVNTTWIWDGTNWTQANPAVKPPARSGASIVYDAARKNIVLFGGFAGGYLNDTWTWDGSNWKQETPSVSPAPRTGAAMAYDSASGSTILFGGSTASGLTADTWAWDGQNWAQLHPQSVPNPRSGAALSYSAVDHGLVLYGGLTGPDATLNDTWIWNGSSWAQIKPLSSPQIGNAIVGMVFDSAWNTSVLIGGETWTWGGQ